MKNKIELILSYLVIASALQFAILVSIAVNFNFTPAQMSSPGMVIIFITACVLNITKLKDTSASRKIYAMALFANLLCLSYAIALSLQDRHIAKVITSMIMAIISLLSFSGWLSYNKGDK